MIPLTKNKTTGTAKEAIHYQNSAVQPIEFCQAVMSKEQFDGFLLGNIIKYRMRAEYKGKYEEDMQKANQYAYWRELFKQGKKIKPVEDSVGDDYVYTGI